MNEKNAAKQNFFRLFITFFMFSLIAIGCIPEASNDESGPLITPPEPTYGILFISAFNTNYKGLQTDGNAEWMDVKISDAAELDKVGNWKVFVGNSKYINLIMSSDDISNWTLGDDDTIRIHAMGYSGTSDKEISENNLDIWDYKTTSKYFVNSSHGILWIEDGFGNILDIVSYQTERNKSGSWLSSESNNPLGKLESAVSKGLWGSSSIDGAFAVSDSFKNYAGLVDETKEGNDVSHWEEKNLPRIILENATITPSSVYSNEISEVLIKVDMIKSDSAKFDSIVIDLSPIGGNIDQTLYDNGENGDSEAGDNIYSIQIKIADNVSAGNYIFNISIVGSNTDSEVTSSVVLIINEPEIVLSDALVNPVSVLQGITTPFLITVGVEAKGGITFTSIEVDLSSIGGSANERMYDDGTNGDEIPSDGIYSYEAVVYDSVAVGEYNFGITTVGSSLGNEETASVTLSVVSEFVKTNFGIYLTAVNTNASGAHADGGASWFDLKISDVDALANIGDWKIYVGNYMYVNLIMSSTDVNWTFENNNIIRVHSKDYTGSTDTDISKNNENIWDFKTSSGFFASDKYGTIWIEDGSGKIIDMFAYSTEKNSKYWIESKGSDPLAKLQSAVSDEQWNGDTKDEAFVFTNSALSYAKLKDDTSDGNLASHWEEIF